MEGIKKTTIMDAETMQRTLKRIAHQIIENTDGAKDVYKRQQLRIDTD